MSAARAVFMSYFVELPDLSDGGMGLTFDLMNVVTEYVKQDGTFHVTSPLEFRFVKAGDSSAMAGTYKARGGETDTWFVSLDLIALMDSKVTSATSYLQEMLKFFAHVERAWVGYGGLPHQGKMYGFYDPEGADGNFSQPFNPNFIHNVKERRAEGVVEAFNTFRKQWDPNGMFANPYVLALVVPPDET